MANIFVEPIEITVEINKGETIHAGLERAGIHIETPCGGNGICGSCLIRASEPDKIAPTHHDNITHEEEAKGLRLSCMAVADSDTSIGLEADYVYENSIHNKNNIMENHANLKILSASISKNSCLDTSNTLKGFAIDIGTTTLVISLVSLTTGKVLASGSSLNPQVIHGHDVLSRIQYSSTLNGLAEMAALVRNRLNELIEQACQETGSHRDEIVDVTIGANTTMLQIAAAIDPVPLGHLPFKVDIEGATTFPADKFGLKINKDAKVYISPVLHAFVGSDISAGLLRCPEFFDDNKSILYLDMGTNGEICLNVKGRRFTTSTAAGPAFEGMGISSGMRATDGAVERVQVIDNMLVFHVIGEELKANNLFEASLTQKNLTENHVNREQNIKGVCGSGIVDFIASLLTTGYLDASGRFKIDSQNRLESYSDTERYYNTPIQKINGHPAFCYGKDIYLTQKDIRQIQLAKGAVRTGIDLILKKGGINCESLDKIYIAGGFGNFLNPESMERIGLLPEHSSDKVVFCGNACIDGCIMLLTDRNARSFLEGALHDMEHLQLADSPEFMSCFVKNLNFG